MSLVPLDTPKSHHSAEDEQRWRNPDRFEPSLNHTLHGPQIENFDLSRAFDFDPNAIQVMDDVEFEHLPEAVNREIVKNSQEIIFEDEEGISQKAPMYEEGNLRNSREIILEEREENVPMRRSLERNIIRSNTRSTFKTYKDEKLPLMKVEENHEDIRNVLQELDRRHKIRNRKDYKMYLEKKLGMQDRGCRIVPVNRNQKDPRMDFFLNEEQKFLRKLNSDRKDDTFVINDRRFFREAGRNAIDQLTVSLNRDQENPQTNLFPNEKQKTVELSRHLIDDPFVMNDGKPFGESKQNAINRKNYEMCSEERLEMHDPFLNKKQDSSDDTKVFEQPEGNATISNMKYIKMLEEGEKSLRESLTLNQRSNCDFTERTNGRQPTVEQYDKIRVESEKRKPASRLAKIIIQHKLHPADLLVSPFSDLSPESGFYEGNLSNLSPMCSRREPRFIPKNKFGGFEEVKGDTSSSENNLSQKNMLGDLGIPEECVQVPIVEVSRHVCDNIQIVDESKTSLHSNLPQKRFIDEDDISVKCVKSRFIEISSCTNDSIEKIDENRASSDNNLSYKHFFENNSTVKCIEVPLNCIGNNIHDIEHRVFSYSDLSSKHFVDDVDNGPKERAEDMNYLSENDQRFVNDNDIVKCANASTAEEKIMRVNNEVQDINEAMKKRSFPKASGKLFNDFGDSEELNCCLMLAKTNNDL